MIDSAENAMSKNILKAERDHKIKLTEAGQETDYSIQASKSPYVCEGCQ